MGQLRRRCRHSPHPQHLALLLTLAGEDPVTTILLGVPPEAPLCHKAVVSDLHCSSIATPFTTVVARAYKSFTDFGWVVNKR
jgi:hypothetical protein